MTQIKQINARKYLLNRICVNLFNLRHLRSQKSHRKNIFKKINFDVMFLKLNRLNSKWNSKHLSYKLCR
jgi:hypothetical protein